MTPLRTFKYFSIFYIQGWKQPTLDSDEKKSQLTLNGEAKPTFILVI